MSDLFIYKSFSFLFGGESMNTKEGMHGANVQPDPFFLFSFFLNWLNWLRRPKILTMMVSFSPSHKRQVTHG
jgi:hypothetical protein